MNKTCKIAAAVIRWTLALVCMVGGQGAAAWMFLDANADDAD